MTKKIKKEVQVILTKNQEKLGKIDNFIVIKSGYARNYLIPQKIAEIATLAAIKRLKVKQKKLESKEKTFIELCKKNKLALEQIGQFTIQKRISNDNKIFGKITFKQIRNIFEKQINIDLGEIKIKIPEITGLGIFPVEIIFHSTVKAIVQLEILPQ